MAMTEGSGVGVAVVGGINLDLVVRVQRHPAPGETVVGGDVFRGPGGKGANQAVAAARLGQRVALVGCVGDDDVGRSLLGSLRADGVDTGAVRVVDGTPSGVALISVDDAGENAIVFSPAANSRLSPDDVEAAAGILADAPVTLLQLEVPLDAVLAAARLAGGTVVLDPAPPRDDLPAELLEEVDILVPSRAELRHLLGDAAPRRKTGVAELASMIEGPRVVVVTMGADGALICSGDRSKHVPAVEVSVADTTAAGDAFAGALADALVRGASVEAATKWAVRAAAVSVTRPGAQASLPGRAEVVATA